MALLFTITLAISVVGMLSLILVKRWELTSGHVLGASLRPAVGAFFHRALVWAEHQAPSMVRRFVRLSTMVLRSAVHRGVAWLVLHAERWLERTLEVLRQRTGPRRAASSESAFLREVAAHKKTLLKRSLKQRTIAEE